jgi:hypothetical protein
MLLSLSRGCGCRDMSNELKNISMQEMHLRYMSYSFRLGLVRCSSQPATSHGEPATIWRWWMEDNNDQLHLACRDSPSS